jgi:hypothetical protein
MPSENHHAFSFIVDGIPLTDDQKATIARAVAEAGTNALSNLNVKQDYVLLPFLPGYRGKPAVSLAVDFDLQQATQRLLETEKGYAAGA